NDGTIRLWSAFNGQPLSALLRHDMAVTSVAFSPDDHRIASASYDGRVHVWNVEASHPLAIFTPYAGWTGNTRAVNGSFSPDSKRLVTANDDHTARIWNVTDGQTLAVLTG